MTSHTGANDSTNLPPATREGILRQIVERNMPASVADLSDLVRIPSVSWEAFDRSFVAQSADAVRGLLQATGAFESVEISQAVTPEGGLGQPAVLATRAARNGRPTVLLYAHHDVQPPGETADWDTDPYEPTVKGDRLYGRGASDDKAGVVSHVAAIRALVESTDNEFDLGLVVFIEGEEEFGSRSFSAFLEKHQDQLAADVIVVADSDNWNIDTPALTISLRGNVTFKLTVRTLEHASHSGMFGGAAPDAMLAAVRLLATLHGDDGAPAVEGLTSTTGVTPEYPEAQLATEAGFVEGVSSVGHGPILSRLWFQPAITITGIDAPSVANASNTLLPQVSVRISARIAPGQSASDAFTALERHVRSHTPFGAAVEISDVDLGDAFLVDTGGWAVREAKQAMRDGWGVDPVDTGIGGSIPFISDLARVFPEAQILVTGVEDPDTRAHSPNESQHLGVFKRAILSEALLLARLDAQTVASLSE
ncbi:dipeptidase [Agreia sp. COWG]|uniref:dipeptidase n=1 Tax=Agreia sp. COWG TaxID=2773266 RepID=UPI001928B44E|nr:dipeptidase [Agreia sp. COWG]CAD5997637.1 M20_dimer domain-containing protein [Agreia sp. COWG]